MICVPRCRPNLYAMAVLGFWAAGAAFSQNGGAPMEINVPLEAAGWQAQPGQVRPTELPRMMRVYEGPEERPQQLQPFGVSALKGEDCTVCYILLNDEPYALRTMVWMRPMPEDDLSRCRYFLLTYRTVGMARSYAPLNAVAIVGPGPDGKETTVPLLPVAEAINDNLWHTIIGQATLPATGTLRVQVGTKDGNCPLYLRTLKLLDTLPTLAASSLERAPDNPAPPAGCQWQPLDLGTLYNDTGAAAFERLLARQNVVIDGANALDGQPLGGVPFQTGGPTANLIRPPQSNADAEPIEFLGVKTTRHYVRPSGRDDVVAVDVGQKAREVLFLMISEVPKGGSRYALPPGPNNFNDIGALSVELQYDTGEPDLAFPYSLADRGFTATRMAGVYAVAADPQRTLKRFVLHNRIAGSDHSLAALTHRGVETPAAAPQGGPA